jgi:DNA-binding beta-propeller fold protein YncE
VNPVVKKFTSSNGTFIGGWGKIEPKANVSEGSLNLPTGIDIDPSGNVYLVDQELDKVQIYDLDGLLKETIGRNVTFEQLSGIAANRLEEFYVIDEGDHSIKKLQNDGTYITKWGNLGSEDGQFSKPTSIAVDPSGNIYVADGGNNRIQKFSNNGTFITKWGSQGVGDGEFNNPKDISIDSSGKVYVADTGNNRIQVFSASNNTLS